MILMKDIIVEGNPILHNKSVDVTIPLTEEDENIMLDMIEYIDNSVDEEIANKYNLRPAVGIAAAQIGINKKMLVVSAFDEEGNEHFYPMINPKIISYSEEKTYLDSGEGCLSVTRNTCGYVHRPKRVTVKTYLYEGEGKTKLVTMRLVGYIAVVFQHEFDHLNGILFVDRINKENPFFIPDNSKPIIFKSDTNEETK